MILVRRMEQHRGRSAVTGPAAVCFVVCTPEYHAKKGLAMDMHRGMQIWRILAFRDAEMRFCATPYRTAVETTRRHASPLVQADHITGQYTRGRTRRPPDGAAADLRSPAAGDP